MGPKAHERQAGEDHPIPIVGLTGGIASGKSTVADLFREMGAVVFDADALAREVVAPASPVLHEIAAAFGPQILAPDGSLDRKRLAAIVFSDPAARQRLEAITHPAIAQAARARAAAAARQGARWVLYEAALLVETGQHEGFDAIVVVSTPESAQIERAARRDAASPAEVRARLAAQLPLADKLRVAHHVIDNSGSLAETRRQVQALYLHFELSWG